MTSKQRDYERLRNSLANINADIARYTEKVTAPGVSVEEAKGYLDMIDSHRKMQTDTLTAITKLSKEIAENAKKEQAVAAAGADAVATARVATAARAAGAGATLTATRAAAHEALDEEFDTAIALSATMAPKSRVVDDEESAFTEIKRQCEVLGRQAAAKRREIDAIRAKLLEAQAELADITGRERELNNQLIAFAAAKEKPSRGDSKRAVPASAEENLAKLLDRLERRKFDREEIDKACTELEKLHKKKRITSEVARGLASGHANTYHKVGEFKSLTPSEIAELYLAVHDFCCSKEER